MEMRKPTRIGVLALQGDFAEHLDVFGRLGVKAVEVRTVGELMACDGLVIPGGESTVMSLLLDKTGLREGIKEFWKKKGAVWGLCAGAIMLSRDSRVDSREVESMGAVVPLGLMDIFVERNAYGRQTESFACQLKWKSLPTSSASRGARGTSSLAGGGKKTDGFLEAVFIRAPKIVEVGKRVQVLATFKKNPVLVRQGRLLACTFHPELTEDSRLHNYFLGMM